jgi:hypothetical protein
MTYIVIPKRKDYYGGILASLILGGAKVKTVAEVDPKDNIIIFHNKPIKVTANKVGWYMGDLRNPEGISGEGDFDYIFLCNKEYAKGYEKRFCSKVVYLPQCGDDRGIKDLGRKLEEKIVFIGNVAQNQFHQNREPIIQALKKHIRVKIVSNEGYSKDGQHLYNTTPISLAISPQVVGYTSNRLYNILSAGGFCLTLYYPGIEDQFENHKHLVWFETPEEAVRLAKYYLKHPKERKKIAKAGKRHYNKHHTGKKRLETMKKHLSMLDK